DLMTDEGGGALDDDLPTARQFHPAQVTDVRRSARRGSGVGIGGRQYITRGDIHLAFSWHVPVWLPKATPAAHRQQCLKPAALCCAVRGIVQDTINPRIRCGRKRAWDCRS